jgi:hypothetical protein
MQLLLQRLCWNSRGWREPTGDVYGKEKSYPGKNGFGHEEWNLNTADLIDGNVYGYTYYNPPAKRKNLPAAYGIYFFAVSPTKDRLLVGAYRRASFLDEAERRELRNRLDGSDYLDRRAKELAALNLPNLKSEQDALQLLLKDFALNVRINPEDVVSFCPPRPLVASDIGGRDPDKINRYRTPVFLEAVPGGAAPAPVVDAPKNLLENDYLRFTPAQHHVIERRHNLLSNRFRAWLSKVGATGITAESDCVDVWCTYSGCSCLFELKTCYGMSTIHAVREAIGQVLEYAFYPGRTEPEHLAIVLDARPADTDIEWLRRLHGAGLKIEIFWLIGEHVYSAGLGVHPLS